MVGKEVKKEVLGVNAVPDGALFGGVLTGDAVIALTRKQHLNLLERVYKGVSDVETMRLAVENIRANEGGTVPLDWTKTDAAVKNLVGSCLRLRESLAPFEESEADQPVSVPRGEWEKLSDANKGVLVRLEEFRDVLKPLFDIDALDVKVRPSVRNLLMATQRLAHHLQPIMDGSITEERTSPRVERERIEALTLLLDPYKQRFLELIKPDDRGGVEDRILSILLNPHVRSGPLENLGYRRAGKQNLCRIEESRIPDIKEKVRFFTNQNKPVELIFPGYAYKSRNPVRCSPVPYDLAEVAGIHRLGMIAEKVRSVYPPGLKFTIVADGEMTAGIYLNDSETAKAYNETVKQIIGHMGPQDSVSIRDINEVTPAGFEDECQRSYARIEKEGAGGNLAKERIIATAISAIDWAGLDPSLVFSLVEAGPSEHPAHFESAKDKAKRYLAMQDALYRLNVYGSAFPNAIRCTFHPKPGQLGIHLVNDSTTKPPWHGTGGLKKDGTPYVDYRMSFERSTRWEPAYLFEGDKYPSYYVET